jgi:hypothetical protein
MRCRTTLFQALLSLVCLGAADKPFELRITSPDDGALVAFLTRLKISLETIPPGVPLKRADFFEDGVLIGSVTNDPPRIVWSVNPTGNVTNFRLTAVAEDAEGRRAVAPPVMLGYSDTCPTIPIVKIVSPDHQAIFPASETVRFGAEVIAGSGEPARSSFSWMEIR